MSKCYILWYCIFTLHTAKGKLLPEILLEFVEYFLFLSAKVVLNPGDDFSHSLVSENFNSHYKSCKL